MKSKEPVELLRAAYPNVLPLINSSLQNYLRPLNQYGEVFEKTKVRDRKLLYMVARGDTIASIALHFNVTINAVHLRIAKFAKHLGVSFNETG